MDVALEELFAEFLLNCSENGHVLAEGNDFATENLNSFGEVEVIVGASLHLPIDFVQQRDRVLLVLFIVFLPLGEYLLADGPA